MNAKVKWILACLGIAAGLLASAYAGRDRLVAPWIAAWLQAAIGRELGVEVAIGRLGGSLLADIEIEDLQTVTPGTRGPVSALRARRLQLHYSAFALLSGLAAFVEGMRIEADGLQAELDLDRGDASSPETRSFELFPPVLPAVQVRDGSVAIRRDELRTRLDGIVLDIEKIDTEARRIRLAAGWSWSHPLLAAGETTVTARLTIAPDSIALQEMDLGGGRVSGQGRLGLTGPSDPAPFEARLKLGEDRLSLAGEVGPSVLNLRMKTGAIEVGPIAALFRRPFSGRLSADIDLTVPFDRPEAVAGRLEINVFNARIHEVDLVTAGAAATAADGWVRIAALDAASGRSRLNVGDAAVPLQPLLAGAWAELLRGFSGRVALSSENLPELLKMIGLAADAPSIRIAEHRLDFAGRLDAGYLRIAHAGLASGPNRILLQGLETRLPPAPPDTPLKGSLHVDLPDLAALARLLPIVAASGSVKAAATIGGSFGRPDAEAVVTAENLAWGGLPVGTVSLKARCDRQQLQVKALSVRRGADTLDGTARIRLPGGDIDAAEFSFAIADLEWIGSRFLPAAWTVGGERPRIQGRARGQARLSGRWNFPDGELTATVEGLRLNASRLGSGSVRISKRGGTIAAGPVRLDQGGDRLELQGCYDIPAGRLDAARLRIECAEAASCLAAFAPAENGLSGRLAVTAEASGPARLPDFSLDFFAERIKTGFGSLAETRILARGGGRQIDIQTAEALTPAGRVQASGSLTRSAAGTVWDATLETFSLERADLRLAMAQPARIRWEAGRGFRIDRFEWAGREGQRVALSGALPIDPADDRIFIPGALSLSAAARLPDHEMIRSVWPDWPIASGAIEADLELEGTWAALRGGLRVNGRTLNPADSSGFVPPGPYEARIETAIEARRIHFQTVAITGRDVQLQGTGVWQDYPAFDQWLTGRPAADGTVALEGRLVAPDLGWLARGFKDIRRVAGRLEADVKVEGPLRDPRLQADLRLTDGELRPEADLPPLQALNLQAGFSGRSLEVRRLQGELGGAPFQMTGAIENILASEGGLRLRLRLTGDDLLLQRSRTFRARANTDLRLSGPPERLELSGSLTLTDGLFTRPFGLAEGLTAGSARPKTGPGFSLFSIESPPFRDMRFEVQIGADKPFVIKNNLVKGVVRPDLRLVGTGEAPELVGKVYLDPTVLFLPAGRMQFDSGVIIFEAVDPGRPRLDMVGTARMIGYDITASVGGPYDEPSVALSSAPPLPDTELLSLVLTGQPPKIPGSEPVEKRQGLNVAVFIGRDILMRMPGGGTTESLQAVLERFDVELGRSVTRAGDETINARFRVADDVLRDKDTLYLTGEKDVYDHYNAGVRIVFRFR